MFWLLTLPLSLLAALFVLVPIWQHSRVNPQPFPAALRQSANIALFHQRSDELEADLSAGEIDQQQFDSLLAELQQNLLADVGSDVEVQTASGFSLPPARTRWQVGIPLVLVLLLLLMAYPLYRQWGHLADIQVMDLFRATVENADDPEQAQELVLSLGRFARSNPDRPWPYYFLGENFAALGMFSEAQLSFARAAQLLDADANKALALGRVATFMYMNSGFELTPQVQAVIEEALQINPAEISILQLLAADAEQRQDWPSAIRYWRLLIQASPDSRMAQDLRTRIAHAQGLTDGADEELDGPVLEVRLSLAEGVELDPELRIFVAARNAAQQGLPPLAALDTTVGDLPATLELSNFNAVGPFNLSSAATVYVSALVSFSGTATPASGDYRVISDSFAHNEERVPLDLVISQQLP